ncbi:MAG: erythromycin esterase family protein [Acidobacteriota bacterium]
MGLGKSSIIIEMVRNSAYQLTGSPADYDPLMDLIGDATFVLLGEASHGTHEFYRTRAEITERLIKEKGFNAVAVEADWPDAYRINRYVRGLGKDADSTEALSDFKRFPHWMWRNADVLDFIGWLREYNDTQVDGVAKVGFYGLDLYSLYSSIEAVLKFMEKVDPDSAKRARERYGCFEQFGEDPQTYGMETGFGLSRSCEDEAVKQLVEMRRRAADLASRDGRAEPDEYFYAEQNARLVKNAEEYYRMMFRGRISTWNLRDHHMAETLDVLASYLESQGQYSKIVVWEHNSHLGDARATERTMRGELNVGQLVREQYGNLAVLVGFSTDHGTVTAATDWGGPAERKRVWPALADSYESLFHNVGIANFLLTLRDEDLPSKKELIEGLREPRLQRAIGVIYRPETERLSHYFHARLPDQFDAIFHFDEARAVEPLERTPEWEAAEVPETYPSGI